MPLTLRVLGDMSDTYATVMCTIERMQECLEHSLGPLMQI